MRLMVMPFDQDGTAKEKPRVIALAGARRGWKNEVDFT